MAKKPHKDTAHVYELYYGPVASAVTSKPENKATSGLKASEFKGYTHDRILVILLTIRN